MVARDTLSGLLAALLASSALAQVGQPPNSGGAPAASLANPTGTAGATAVNGSASTAMRSDAAPAIGSGAITAALLAAGAAISNIGYTPAHGGANADITALNGLTTPLATGEGGTSLNNPSGFVFYNGASAPTVSTTINLAQMAQAPANTLRGNPTGSTANVQDVAMPSCSGVAQVLTYVPGSGLACATPPGIGFRAGQVLGVTMGATAPADYPIALTGPTSGSWHATRAFIGNCRDATTLASAAPGSAAGSIYTQSGGAGALVLGQGSVMTWTGVSLASGRLLLHIQGNSTGYSIPIYTTATGALLYFHLASAGTPNCLCDLQVYGEVD